MKTQFLKQDNAGNFQDIFVLDKRIFSKIPLYYPTNMLSNYHQLFVFVLLLCLTFLLQHGDASDHESHQGKKHTDWPATATTSANSNAPIPMNVDDAYAKPFSVGTLTTDMMMNSPTRHAQVSTAATRTRGASQKRQANASPDISLERIRMPVKKPCKPAADSSTYRKKSTNRRNVVQNPKTGTPKAGSSESTRNSRRPKQESSSTC